MNLHLIDKILNSISSYIDDQKEYLSKGNYTQEQIDFSIGTHDGLLAVSNFIKENNYNQLMEDEISYFLSEIRKSRQKLKDIIYEYSKSNMNLYCESLSYQYFCGYMNGFYRSEELIKDCYELITKMILSNEI